MKKQNFEDISTDKIKPHHHIILGTTAISWIDDVNGKLYYRGIDVAELAAHSTFEETVLLLFLGRLPVQKELERFTWMLANSHDPQEKILRIIQELPRTSSPLWMLQTSLAALACVDTDDDDLDSSDYLGKVAEILAQTSVILASSYRHCMGLPLLPPRYDLLFVDNFLYMIEGKIPSKHKSKSMESAFIIQMDQGLTPASFTARAVSSTFTRFYSALSAAVGSLSGSLTEGVDKAVEDLLNNAFEVENFSSMMAEICLSKNKLKNLGVEIRGTQKFDARADIFKDLLFKLSKPEDKRCQKLAEIEDQVHFQLAQQGKYAYIHFDFWSGAVYKKLGLQPVLYPSLFVIARMAGWCAHMIERKKEKQLYKPKSVYVGLKNIPYKSLNERSENDIS